MSTKLSMIGIVIVLLVILAANSGSPSVQALQATSPATQGAPTSRTVFIIVMENHDWAPIKGSPSAPYINSLLATSAHADQYYNPPGVHPSLPNYLWLEAGTDFGIRSDDGPSTLHQATTDHLVTLLEKAGMDWTVYAEGISGKDCPLKNRGLYAVRHNPVVYFDDVSDNNDPASQRCISHVRPYPELADNLKQDKIAAYNFIVPDVCNDMHNLAGCKTLDSIKNGDVWLSAEVPKILDSEAYKAGGVLFIVWDESEDADGPIGLIAVSSIAKPGYANSVPYTHSSLLRTVQEFLNVKPLLGDAANATSLADLFTTYP